MNIGDWIQTAVLFLAALAVSVAAWQTRIQNRLLKAQLLRDRFEMYWQTYEPVTEEQVAELKLYPEDYMEICRYKSHYEGNDEAIRKYIYMSNLYEYLAFTYTLHHVLKVPDPLGSGWVEQWTTELANSDEFKHVHNEYHGYYPKFEYFVENMRPALKTSQSPSRKSVPAQGKRKRRGPRRSR